MNTTTRNKIMTIAALAALMAATRPYHFGSVLHLPDASLAVFLLAGFYLPRWVFPLLLIEAGLVDFLALNYGGVDGWCFSPAYWFLIPTYFAMWFGGRFFRARYRFSLRGLSEFAAIALAATGAAFLISNSSFYLFAGYFETMGAVQYGTQVSQYFWPYLQSAILYLSAAVFFHIFAVLVERRVQQA